MSVSVSAPVAAAALAALCACQSGSDPTTPWEVRSRPGVQVVGDTVKRRRGELPPATSALFDGRAVRLRAARGEVLGLEVLLERTGPRPVSLDIAAPAAAVAIQPFEVGFLDVTEPSSDGESGPSAGPGAYPDILRPASGPVTAADQVFFDVSVAAAAQPGLYRGELSAGPDRFPVELTVEPVEIHVELEPWLWVWFKSSELAREHDLPDDDRPELLAVERAYSDLFRRHGCLLASDYPRERLARRLALLTPDVRYWPVALSKTDTALMARQTAEWIDFFRGRPQMPFTFTIDEPRRRQRDEVRRHGEVVHGAGGGPGRLLFSVTDAADPLYRGAVDVFTSPLSIPPPPGWGPSTHFWTYNGKPPRAGNMTIDKPGTALRTWGWIGARYGVELWFAWEGLYYTDRYNRGTQPTDVLHHPLNYDERRRGDSDWGDWGNGDGLLVYPGPLPSLRLKALRRGLQDRLLLRHLAACGPGGAADAAALARRLIPAALGEADAEGGQPWPAEEPPWEAARRKILDRIASRCPQLRR
ncbi:MAG TPA: glycoside hydrolase domain-containing protein [Kofleriaceae bacterium]|nr:glycoside hydrolase domain-containing protein [Kofleriaceae bacterium]